MGSITATILIGRMHPNDELICPSHLATLHEGDRPAWSLQVLAGKARRRTWLPSAYEMVWPTFLALAAAEVLGADTHLSAQRACHRLVLTQESDGEVKRLADHTRSAPRMAFVATVSRASSLSGADLRGLDAHDRQIYELTWARTYSDWARAWTTESDRANVRLPASWNRDPY